MILFFLLCTAYTKPEYLGINRLVHAQVPSPTPTPTPSPTPIVVPPASPLRGAPVRLIIPILHTDTTILPMGVTDDGSMEVPESITDVGWYKLGARPGETGTAVIAGHVDGKNGEPGVFAQLNALKPGDALGVEDEFGNIGAFIVRESKTYDQSVDTSKIFASTDGMHLNLITCEGAWDQMRKTYTKRLVVFTDLMK